MLFLVPPGQPLPFHIADDSEDAAAAADVHPVTVRETPVARASVAAPAWSERPEPPAVRQSAGCPACGRNPAVVFPRLQGGAPPSDAPLVCLGCCPPTPRS